MTVSGLALVGGMVLLVAAYGWFAGWNDRLFMRLRTLAIAGCLGLAVSWAIGAASGQWLVFNAAACLVFAIGTAASLLSVVASNAKLQAFQGVGLFLMLPVLWFFAVNVLWAEL